MKFLIGLYKMYNKEKIFIGLGEVKENKLKRDLVV